MRKLLVVLIISVLAMSLIGCVNNDNIISLVDDPQGYNQIDTEYESEYGNIIKVYEKESRQVIHVSGKGGYYGDIELVVLVVDDRIENIKGFNIKETPDIGTKALEESYLNQMIGINLDREILVGGKKPNDSIDVLYVTGASFSSKAVLGAINTLILWYNR